MNQKTELISAPKIFASACFFVLVSVPVHANSIQVSADSYGYKPDFGGFNLDFTPMGAALGGSVDIMDGLSLQLDWGQWKDDDSMNGQSSADFKSSLISFGMEYSMDNWTLNARYLDVSDEIAVRHGMQQEFFSRNDADSMSLRLSAEYEKKIDNWALYAEGGLQYDEADIDAVFDQENLLVQQKDTVWFSMAKVGGDYYLPTGENSAWFIGGTLSWYQELSSDTDTTQSNTGTGGPLPPPGMGGSMPPRRPPPGVGGGGRGRGININRTFGDSFGILGVYATYQINEIWSLDLSSSFGFSGERNSNSHALTLTFSF